MSRRLRIPPPPLAYAVDYERVRNREIESVVNEKISNTDQNLYGGIPFTAIAGIDPAWSVDAGATAIVPFNTVKKDTDPDVLFNTTGHFIIASFVFDALITVALNKPATGGNTVFDIILLLFSNGVEVNRYVYSASTRDSSSVTFSGVAVAVPENTEIDIRVTHTHNSAVVFDLTKSSWNIVRMSPLPRSL